MFFVIVSFLMTFLVPVAFVIGVFVGWTPAKPRISHIDCAIRRAVREASEKILDEAEKKGLL